MKALNRGSIRERKSTSKNPRPGPKTWEIEIYYGHDPLTGKHKRYFETIKGELPDAEKRRRKILTQLDENEFKPNPSKMKVNDVLTSWLEGYAKTNCSHRTYTGYESIVRNYLKQSLGNLPLRAVTQPVIQSTYGKIGERLSRRTVNHTHRVLSQALKWAVMQGYIAQNPCTLVTVKVQRSVTMRTLTPSELDDLLKTAEGDYYYPVIFTAVKSGLRQSELLGLRWRDIDLNLCTMSINQVLYKRAGRCEFKVPKTAGSRRRVEMTPKLAIFLKKYKKQRENIYLETGRILGLDNLVFESVNFEPLNQTTLGHAFHKIAIKAVFPGLRFHDLRHTFASLMLLRGVAPKVISEALGHSSVAFTMDVYSHIIEGMQKDAMALLDDVTPDGYLPSAINGKLTAKYIV